MRPSTWERLRSSVPVLPPSAEDFKLDWGEPPPFNERTWRHRLFSDEQKRRLLRYDSLGRVIRGPNRL